MEKRTKKPVVSIGSELVGCFGVPFKEKRTIKPVVSIGSELVGCFGETQTVKKKVQKRPFLKPIAFFQHLDD